MVGVHIAYYLVHSMGSANGFEEEDHRSAHAFAVAARDAGVQRIVYLGGLGSTFARRLFSIPSDCWGNSIGTSCILFINLFLPEC